MRIAMSLSKPKHQQTRNQKPASTLIIRRQKKNDQEWKKFSFRSVNDGIDCGDKQCFLEYRTLPDCYLVLETNNTNCRIPCIMDGCDKELHHFIPCPLWSCDPITSTSSTTTSTTTKTTSTTTTPTTTSTTSSSTTTSNKPNKPSEMSPLIYTSIVLNIFFVAILLAYVIVKCRIKITATLAGFRARRSPTTANPNPNEHFSVGGSSDEESEVGIDSHVQSHERERLLPPQAKAIARHGSVEQGHDNLALDVSNTQPKPSCSNWQDTSRAILGGDPIQNVNHLPMPSTSTNWQDVSLASSSSQTSLENPSASLNQVESEPKKQTKPSEKPIFMLMKTFKKK